MTEQHPGERPGHLDIDAVSAYVDRDLDADDLRTIEFHLHECPACHREVLEIRTTVMLLAGLPQYTPRRSFCLGLEHARAARRRGRASTDRWSIPFPSPRQPAVAMTDGGGVGHYAGWLSGLQAAAMVVGVLLLLVTTSDLYGIPAQPAEWLTDPTAPAPAQLTAPASAPLVTATAVSAGIAADQSRGTSDGDRASEEMPADENLEAAPPARSMATEIVAAVTQAAPTAAAGRAPESAPPEGAAARAEQTTPAEPSRMRLVQMALAFALAWLIVTIVGLRWVRRLREDRAPRSVDDTPLTTR